eukprot:CAMPEP_0174381404 /NCGR_PEP_ID=MMETSP0811_2-20130205/123988_1 /TAXON_ID=73025 ORGANISM="Eutreptiella gymnastica-like, Strain CCMP1594" /NCGR_SAMPLE_ID=MMETSP0811_2 /ASSEMBLY_ACC=CAM_ASM_000667 /LENGTH=177 /DNA_ID=CAMNT_0015534535 /DNA_START=3059 /DNA_END=3593 /DNA_ORIENTATION=+
MCIFSSRSLLVGGHHIEAQGLDTLAFMQRPQLVTLGSENFSQLAPEQRCAALNAPVLLDQPPMPPSSCQPIPRRSLPAHSGSSEVRSQPPGEGQARPELGRQVLLLGSRAPRNTESLPMLAIAAFTEDVILPRAAFSGAAVHVAVLLGGGLLTSTNWAVVKGTKQLSRSYRIATRSV